MRPRARRGPPGRPRRASQRPSVSCTAAGSATAGPTSATKGLLVAEAERHPEAAWVRPRLTGPDDMATPRRWVPRLRALNPGRPGKGASTAEGVVLIRRDAFDAARGRGDQLSLYHEGFGLAWRLHEAGWSGWYAASIRMHHPPPSPPACPPVRLPRAVPPARRPQPDPDRPPRPPHHAPPPPPERLDHDHLGPARAVRGGGPGQTPRGMREGRTSRHTQRRRPMSWRAVYRLTAAGRPPAIRPLCPARHFEESSSP